MEMEEFALQFSSYAPAPGPGHRPPSAFNHANYVKGSMPPPLSRSKTSAPSILNRSISFPQLPSCMGMLDGNHSPENAHRPQQLHSGPLPVPVPIQDGEWQGWRADQPGDLNGELHAVDMQHRSLSVRMSILSSVGKELRREHAKDSEKLRVIEERLRELEAAAVTQTYDGISSTNDSVSSLQHTQLQQSGVAPSWSDDAPQQPLPKKLETDWPVFGSKRVNFDMSSSHVAPPVADNTRWNGDPHTMSHRRSIRDNMIPTHSGFPQDGFGHNHPLFVDYRKRTTASMASQRNQKRARSMPDLSAIFPDKSMEFLFSADELDTGSHLQHIDWGQQGLGAAQGEYSVQGGGGVMTGGDGISSQQGSSINPQAC